MKDERLFEIGEQVLVPMKVIKREFDERGAIKYKLKDQKSGKILDWFYTDKDIASDITYEQKQAAKKERKTTK